MSQTPPTLEDTKAALQKTLAQIPYAATLGIVPNFRGAEFYLTLPFKRENIGNPTLPALHGGGIGGFMEVSAIAELLLRNPGAKFPKPIGVNIDYLRRGKPVDTFARADIFKQGSRVANVRVRAWQESWDKPIAALSGHFLLASEDD